MSRSLAHRRRGREEPRTARGANLMCPAPSPTCGRVLDTPAGALLPYCCGHWFCSVECRARHVRLHHAIAAGVP